jgi:3-hydroxybutyryl-CoA dehydrogenase
VASFCAKPENVIGMHFMNPVPVMKLVEVIRGLQTSDATLEKTQALAAKMKKVTTLSSDRPGFIANRVLMPYINEAIQVLNEGIATKEDIDQTMKLGTNVPMGPLTLADFIGLDTCLSIMNVLHREFGDSKYRPSPLLVNYVNAGWLGKKTGRGFYEYKK